MPAWQAAAGAGRAVLQGGARSTAYTPRRPYQQQAKMTTKTDRRRAGGQAGGQAGGRAGGLQATHPRPNATCQAACCWPTGHGSACPARPAPPVQRWEKAAETIVRAKQMQRKRCDSRAQEKTNSAPDSSARPPPCRDDARGCGPQAKHICRSCAAPDPQFLHAHHPAVCTAASPPSWAPHLQRRHF